MSSAPRFAPSSLNCTPATPLGSVAVAVTLVVPRTVAPSVGALIATAGPVVSGGALVVKVQLASAASGVPSEAFTPRS